MGVILCITAPSGKGIRHISCVHGDDVIIPMAMTTSLEYNVLRPNCSRGSFRSKVLSTRLNDPFSNIHATPFFFCKIRNLFERGDVVDNVYQIVLCTEHCATCRGAERKAAAILLWHI